MYPRRPIHIALLGDSILDNAPYTAGGPDVTSQLNDLLAGGDTATLLAVDGSTTTDIEKQTRRIPSDCTHLVLSVGGNDALLKMDVLGSRVRTIAEALLCLADVADDFERSYTAAIEHVLARGLPTILCTIYNGAFEDQREQIIVRTALRIYNDIIGQAALDHGLTVVDLRRVCSTADDYANPIEPSSAGGAKIARSLLAALQITEPETYSLSP